MFNFFRTRHQSTAEFDLAQDRSNPRGPFRPDIEGRYGKHALDLSRLRTPIYRPSC